MSEKKEGKEVKVNLSLTSNNLFTYGAIVDAVLGVVWAICGCFSSVDAFKAYNVFQGLFFAVLGGLVIYGLSQIIKSKQ